MKDGIVSSYPAEKLGAEVLREVVSRFELPTDAIDYIIGGMRSGRRQYHASGRHFRQRFQTDSGGYWICSAGRRWRRSARQQPRLRAGWRIWSLPGNGEFFGTAVPHDVPEPSGYDGGKVYTVAQFVPGKRGEQVMLEGAEETAIRENISKEEMDTWVLRSHKRAAQARKEGILEDITVSIDGSSRDEGIRPTMSQRLIDRLPYLLPKWHENHGGKCVPMHDGAAFVVLCSERFCGNRDGKQNAVSGLVQRSGMIR